MDVDRRAGDRIAVGVEHAALDVEGAHRIESRVGLEYRRSRGSRNRFHRGGRRGSPGPLPWFIDEGGGRRPGQRADPDQARDGQPQSLIHHMAFITSSVSTPAAVFPAVSRAAAATVAPTVRPRAPLLRRRGWRGKPATRAALPATT